MGVGDELVRKLEGILFSFLEHLRRVEVVLAPGGLKGQSRGI